MSTTRTFQDMLNEYLPNKMLKEELIDRCYILNNIEKDQKWMGGKIAVPFKAAGGSSVRMGGLTDQADISEDLYVRGSIDAYVEMWGSMVFNHRDILDHSGRVKEDSFLKILPDALEDFMEYMKMVASIQLGTGPHFAKSVSDTGLASGLVTVDHIDRFSLGQKVTLDDDNSVPLSVYVTAIDVNASTVTVSATRGGAALDVSAYTLAQNAKFYTDGADATYFTSIRSVLLSAANGGSTNVHGKSKLAYPFLQAVNISGAGISSTNLLDRLLDAYAEVRKKAKGSANTFLMSYKHLNTILKLLEKTVSNSSISVDSKKASNYGWDEITINTVKGKLKIVGIQEWDDDTIAILNMKTLTFRSNGMFQKRKSPEGHEFFEVRATSGFKYIVDVSLFGELEFTKPGENAIIYGITY